MNALDKLIAVFAPERALRRRQARAILAHYEAADPSRLRKHYRERGSANEIVQRGAVAVRAQARHLVRNHDLARGALRVLVNNVVGAKGVGVEPQPRRADGTIHSDYAAALLEAWRDWCRYPEVTHRLPWSRLQRAMARAWFRDGEVFGQMIIGNRPDLDHGTRVPFSLEAFEADMVPFDLQDPARRILQGIERNQWGKPLAIHVLKQDAGTLGQPLFDTKRIPWDRALHLATLDHIGQIRGVSEFASVLGRMEDIKDYEESERVAAKIAAMLTAYVKKGTPDLFEPGEGEGREISFKPGMVIDDLGPGEEIGMIDSKRPNPNLITFRAGQLRAVAAGLGASYSSVARDYNGTYSAQRQEMVEQWTHYAVLTDEFTGEVVQPVWENFVRACHLSGVVRIPADCKPGTEDDALYTAQAMPWIDPMKEAMAWRTLVESGFASEVEAIRRRGANPADVLEQIAEFRKHADELGLQFNLGGSAPGTGTTDPALPGDDTGEESETEPTTQQDDQVAAIKRDTQRQVSEIQIGAAKRIAEADAAAAEARVQKAQAEAAAEVARALAQQTDAEYQAIRLSREADAAQADIARAQAEARALADRTAAEQARIAAEIAAATASAEAARLHREREELELIGAREALDALRQHQAVGDV